MGNVFAVNSDGLAGAGRVYDALAAPVQEVGDELAHNMHDLAQVCGGDATGKSIFANLDPSVQQLVEVAHNMASAVTGVSGHLNLTAMHLANTEIENLAATTSLHTQQGTSDPSHPRASGG